MSQKVGACLVGLLLAAVPVDATEQHPIRSQQITNNVFLNCADVATALDLEFKVIQPGRLVTFCREGDESYCIPVQLTKDDYRSHGPATLVTANKLSKALRFKVIDVAGKLTIERQSDAIAEEGSTAPGYNADWGPGRGFREGNTLPDIPLVDLEGNEVRFSQFLGKRYILYCWASW
jgi:hypothetical protein